MLKILKRIWNWLCGEYPCSLFEDCCKVFEKKAAPTDEYPCSLVSECIRIWEKKGN